MPIKHTSHIAGLFVLKHTWIVREYYKTFWKKSNTNFFIICDIKGQSIKVDDISLSQIGMNFKETNFWLILANINFPVIQAMSA